MKAIIYETYGPAEVLKLRDVPKPSPKDNEVLIRVYAAEASKSDCELRSFNLPVIWFWLPLRIMLGLRKPKRQILGSYFAGEIEAVGKDVSKFTPGDKVFGSSQLRLGAYAEYLCLPESYTLVAKPENMSFVEAAAVPLGGLNALHFLNNAKIQKGEKVLINGAGGSIGVFAVQIAKMKGAEVTAVDSGIKEAMLRRIGADKFIDYTKQDFSADGERYDVILNMVAQQPYSKSLKALKAKGRYMLANPRLSDMLRAGFDSRFTDKTVSFALAGEKVEELLTLKALIEQGTLYSVVDKLYPMIEAAKAHHYVETEQRLGSIVIAIGDV